MLQCDITERPVRAQARRQHLLDTARALFTQRGFHQTGVAQIATASGIGVGQIYRDFESKEAIIAAIAEADVTAWLEEDVLCAAVAAHDFAAIRAWVDRFGDCDETREECQLMTEILAESGRNPRIAEIHRTIDKRIRTSLTAALEALTGKNSRDDKIALLVEFILASGTGVMVRRIINPDGPTEELSRFVGTILDHKLDMLMR
jgi:AcrR family transcriptional regulator